MATGHIFFYHLTSHMAGSQDSLASVDTKAPGDYNEKSQFQKNPMGPPDRAAPI
jgi:hypothetical protein